MTDGPAERPLDEGLLAKGLATLPRRRTQVLPALHLLHEQAGYLSSAGLEEVARWLYVPRSELYAIASSYTELRMSPPLDDAVYVCRGVSCEMAGAEALASELRGAGRTVVDHECLFVCAVAPVVKTAAGTLGRATAGAAG